VIVFVRHGETEPNRAGVLLGRADPALTATGREQAAAVAKAFDAPTAPVAIVSSPLRRAIETAEVIASVWKMDVEREERLIEIDYGEWDQRGFGDVPREELSRWRADPAYTPPGGESLAALQARVTPCAAELLERTGDDGMVIAVSHVSPIKAAVAWALAVGPEIAWRLRLDIASITRIAHGPDGGPMVRSFNERAH
jgi:broad specificity phosphatase PhoE